MKKLDVSADAIKALRKSLKLNQSEFWGRISVTQSGGSRYESGRDISEPIQLLLRIAYGSDEEAGYVIDALRKR